VEAVALMEGVIDQAAHAITEGRDAVQGLRAATIVGSDLPGAISALGQELAADPTIEHGPNFRLQVEGTPKPVAPLVADEAYRIAGEALRNAFRHANALHVEVEIHYARKQFRLRVRDDGQGIDTAVLERGGQTGHFGLAGMHERAKLVGGTLAVWSERASGTEAELTIPASVAYAKSAVRQSALSGVS